MQVKIHTSKLHFDRNTVRDTIYKMNLTKKVKTKNTWLLKEINVSDYSTLFFNLSGA